MIIFIPIKHDSVRVPGKNFRDFNGTPLYLHTIKKYINNNGFRIFIDTDSDFLIEHFQQYCLKFTEVNKPYNICIYKRNSNLIGHNVSVDLLIENFIVIHKLDKVKTTKPICQIHVTSPFLKPETLTAAEKQLYKYDSIMGVNKLHSRLWKQFNNYSYPLNHDPRNLIPTQNLEPVYEENSAFYMFTVDSFLKTKSRVGLRPGFFEVNHPENLDIDTEEQFKMCQDLSKILT